MTQEILLEWLIQYGCRVTHQKKHFYRVVNSEGKAMGVPEPRAGHTNLQAMTVCRICTMLKVPIPDYAKAAYEAYQEIQRKHQE